MSPDGTDNSTTPLTVEMCSSHPIAIGETVAIFRIDESAMPVIEGRARVKDLAHGPHRYRVQFIGDPTVRERIIHREYQSDPERMLSIICDLWNADHAASPSFSEFFPDETT